MTEEDQKSKSAAPRRDEDEEPARPAEANKNHSSVPSKDPAKRYRRPICANEP